MASIGEEQEEVEIVPLDAPILEPVTTPVTAPAEPEKVPV